MNELSDCPLPTQLNEIESETAAMGFTMPSDRQVGRLLRTLAASKPGGKMLELGTGTGLSAAWLADGMDDHARLITIDNDPRCSDIARRYLGADPRISILCSDASMWLQEYEGPLFDLVFADTWAGKYLEPDLALSLLRAGGIYIVDDMEIQPHWTASHKEDARNLLHTLVCRKDLLTTPLNWASGMIIAVRVTRQ